MNLSKTVIKKIIGYLSSIVVLVFLGQDFLVDGAQMISMFYTQANGG